MPHTKSIFDLPADEAEEARLDAIGLAELDAGQAIPHERVREWLLRRGKGETVPLPTA